MLGASLLLVGLVAMCRSNLRAVAAGLLTVAVLLGSVGAPMEHAAADGGCPPAGQLPDDDQQNDPADPDDDAGEDPDEETVERFAVTYTANAGGTIDGDTPQRIERGEDASPVTAIPDAGHRFVDWSDGLTTARRHDRDVTAKLDVEARFAAFTYDLAYTAGAHGSLGGDAAQTVAHGTSGTAVTAVPDVGYEFVRWSDGSTDNPRLDANVTADLSVVAEFDVSSYRVRYTAGVGGSVTGNIDQQVPHGDDATAVTAVPDAGRHFVRWSDGSTANPRTDAAVVADLAVTAEFARNVYRLQYAAGAGGSLSGDADQDVEHGDDGAAVTAVPATGRHFVQWSDGSTANPRTDLGVTADLSVTATFDVNTYTVVYSAGANGSVSPSAPQTVDHGDGVSATATPDTGYRFVAWSDGSTANPRTDANVTANLSVTAQFAQITYPVQYSAGANGSIGGTATQSVAHGTSASAVTAVPDVGYRFVQWSDGSTANPRTDVNVTAALSVSAQFAVATYSLDYSAGPGGSLTGNADQSVEHGDDGTAVTAVPNTGHHFVRWSDGSTSNPRTDVNVVADVDVDAVFAINTYTLTYSAGPGGSLSGDADQSVEHGDDGTAVTAVPDAGYLFVEWSDGSTVNPRTDVAVAADLDVEAEFTTAVVLARHGTSSGLLGPDASELAVRNTDVAAAEYLLVARNMGPDALTMTTSITGNAASAIAGLTASASPSSDLDTARRRTEVARAEAARGTSGAGTPLVPAAGLPLGVLPSVGDTLRLNRSLAASCVAAGVGTDAEVLAVGSHAIVVADLDNPVYPGALAPLDTLAGYANELLTTFDDKVYPAVTAAFGTPSDVDANGRVVLFITRGVNELAPPASVGVNDLARPMDLLGQDECAISNEGEVIYLAAPDATGAINSNVRTSSFTFGASQTGMAHQLGHLIGDGAHLQQGAELDDTWVSMALADAATERVFYGESVGLTPLMNIVVSMITTGPNASRRVAAYNTFANPNFGRFRAWLQSPHRTGVLAETGTQAARGAGWAFLRYAADRFAGGDLAQERAFWAALVGAEGAPGVAFEEVTGAQIEDWYRDFTIAMYTDDDPDSGTLGTTGAYANLSWSFRSLFTALNGNYQLSHTPLAVDGSSVDTFALRGGSRYLRFAVAAGGQATLDFAPGAWSDPDSRIEYTVVRLR